MAIEWGDWDRVRRLERMIFGMQIHGPGQLRLNEDGIAFVFDDQNSTSGTSIKWAKVTAVTDANNYTCSIWNSRASYLNGDIAAETGKAVRVPDIIDSMAVNSTFAVEAQSTITGVDYMAIQQLADI